MNIPSHLNGPSIKAGDSVLTVLFYEWRLAMVVRLASMMLKVAPKRGDGVSVIQHVESMMRVMVESCKRQTGGPE